MNDAIQCPGCEVQLLLPVLPAGQTVACPRCQRVFEPAGLRTSAAAPTDRPKTPMPLPEAGDELTFTPPPTPIVFPRGAWRGRLAVALLAVSSLAFAVQAYCEIELIWLIHAQDELGAPRAHPHAPFRFEVAFGGIRRLRPAPPPDPRQVLLDERWQRWEEFTPDVNLAVHVWFWSALLAVLIWLHRAHKNLPSLRASGLSFTPAWAFLAFIVPVFNLVVPFAFIQEIWRASHPNAIDTPRLWREGAFARCVRIWWVFYAAAIVLWAVAFFAAPRFPATYDDVWISAAFAAIASICSSGAGVTLIFIIRKITQRQLERYNHL